jgi:hypothetical protein
MLPRYTWLSRLAASMQVLVNATEVTTVQQTISVRTTVIPTRQSNGTCLWRRPDASPRSSYVIPGASFSALLRTPSRAATCNGPIAATVISCTDSQGRTGTCSYDAATDRLTLLDLSNGTLFVVNVAATDPCGVTANLQSVVALVVAGAMPSSVTTPYGDVDCRPLSLCRNDVGARTLPRGQPPVCTRLDVLDGPGPPLPNVKRVCLAVTAQADGCSGSSTKGRLVAVAFDASAWGVTAGQLTVTGEGIQPLGAPCKASGNDSYPQRLTQCGTPPLALTVPGVAPPWYDMAFLVGNSVTWSGGSEANLGCFVLTGPVGSELTFSSGGGWSFGAIYNGTDAAQGQSPNLTRVDAQICNRKGEDPYPLPCPVKSLVRARDPVAGDRGGQTSQICTRWRFEGIGEGLWRACVQAESLQPGCAPLPFQGRLGAVFLDSNTFAVPSPGLLTFGPDASLPPLGAVCLPTGSASSLTACGSFSAATVVRQPFNAALTVTAPRWTGGPANSTAFCFTVGEVPRITLGPLGAAVGAVYTEVGVATGAAGRSGMAGRVCPRSAPPPLAPPNPESNVVATRFRPSCNERLPLACVAVALELVDAETVRVDLRVTRTYPLCEASAARGVLQAVYIDSSALVPGVTNPEALSFEDGSIQVTRPTCAAVRGALRCGNTTIPPVGAAPLSVGFQVANNVSWSSPEAALGSFFITYAGGFDSVGISAALRGWLVGFRVLAEVAPGSSSVPGVMLGRLFTPPPPTLNMSATCPRNIVSTRVPLAAGVPSFQACSAVTFRRVSASVLEVCVGVTDALPQCAKSSRAGALKAIFLTPTDGGLSVPTGSPLDFQGSTALALSQPNCSACLGLAGRSLAVEPLEAALQVGSQTAWSGTPRADLGCFYVTSPGGVDLSPAGNLVVGLLYESTSDSGQIVMTQMVGRVCRPPPPPLPLPLRDPALLTERSNEVPGGLRVCTSVQLARVEPQVLQLCLAVFGNDTVKECRKADDFPRAGILSQVVLSSAFFGVPNVDMLLLESGSLTVRRNSTVKVSPQIGRLDLVVSFADEPAVRWDLDRDPSGRLGCFFVTGTGGLNADNEGLRIRVRYSQLEKPIGKVREAEMEGMLWRNRSRSAVEDAAEAAVGVVLARQIQTAAACNPPPTPAPTKGKLSRRQLLEKRMKVTQGKDTEGPGTVTFAVGG